MANKRFSIEDITGVPPKNVKPIEILSLPEENLSLPVTSKPQPLGPEEGKKVAKSTNMKGPEEHREKKNFFITNANCLKISLLAKYMGCGPGHIVDMALDRFFSDPEVTKKIRKEMEVDRLEKEVLEKSL